MKLSAAPFCCFAALCTLVHSQSNSTCFDLFVDAKMRDFPRWLQSNNLDPSPLLPETYYSTQIHPTYLFIWRLSNHVVRGHSENITIRNTVSDFDRLSFTTDIEMSGNVISHGNYYMSGIIWRSTPQERSILGDGSWYITVPSYFLNTFRIRLTWDQINNIVNIRDGSLPITLADGYGVESYLDNMFGDNFTNHEMSLLKYSLFVAYSGNIKSTDRMHPLKLIYLQYWNETFREATPDEIFACSTPEPITTEAATPSIQTSTISATPSSTTSCPPTTPFSTTAPEPSECPQTGMDLIPHPTSCSAYFICIDGTAYEQECSEGLHFNPVIKECDIPENINCTKPLPECPAEGVSFHPYPGNCSLYVICAEGTPFVRTCAESTCFDTEELKCRLNDTVSFDIPEQVTFELNSRANIDVVSTCRGTSSRDQILVATHLNPKQFSLCHDGVYKATFRCPSGQLFDPDAQDCVNDMNYT